MAEKQKTPLLYEGMYIISASLSEEARAKALDKITLGITSRGGTVHKIHDRGRKRLAYKINTRREGYYYVLFFDLPPACIKEIWKEHQLHEDLLRYLHLRVDSVQETIEFKSLERE